MRPICRQLWREGCGTVANDADFHFVVGVFSISETVLPGSHATAWYERPVDFTDKHPDPALANGKFSQCLRAAVASLSLSNGPHHPSVTGPVPPSVTHHGHRQSTAVMRRVIDTEASAASVIPAVIGA